MTTRTTRRSGATLVEAAMVLSLALLLLFGIFEYARYMFTLQIVENAAREGARMAVAHTDNMTTAGITAGILQRLADQNSTMPNFNIDIHAIALRTRTDANGTVTAGTLIPDWTQAAPTDGIVVTLTGDFVPILPSFLQMGATIPVRCQSVMYSEGN